MSTDRFVGLALVIVGAGLLFWGIRAGDSFSSGFSKLFQNAPSNKSIVLLVAGALVAALGCVKLLRRSST